MLPNPRREAPGSSCMSSGSLLMKLSLVANFVLLFLLLNKNGNAATNYAYEVASPLVFAHDSEHSTAAASESEVSFYDIAAKHGTDKNLAVKNMEPCLKNGVSCIYPDARNLKCRPWGHFYHTMYQRWLGPMTKDRFQFMEIGYFTGKGFDSYSEFLPLAETHSIEYSCKSNAAKNPHYKEIRNANRLHCGDASSITFLEKLWTTHMKRAGAPPLRVVVDDASHAAAHMVQSVLFWFPRIEPGGLMIVEDIQPLPGGGPNRFRTQFLPQIMSDLHYCGSDKSLIDAPCFPTLQPLLQAIHCEMHICVFERNEHPSFEPSLADVTMPANALKASQCASLSS